MTVVRRRDVSRCQRKTRAHSFICTCTRNIDRPRCFKAPTSKVAAASAVRASAGASENSNFISKIRFVAFSEIRTHAGRISEIDRRIRGRVRFVPVDYCHSTCGITLPARLRRNIYEIYRYHRLKIQRIGRRNRSGLNVNAVIRSLVIPVPRYFPLSTPISKKQKKTRLAKKTK